MSDGNTKCTVVQDKKLGTVVEVQRFDVPLPFLYTKDTDGYRYWLAQAVAQAEREGK
jgi:hypothetical protein